jgi:hypothetical protein
MSSIHAFHNVTALLAAQYAVTLGVVRGVERELPRAVVRVEEVVSDARLVEACPAEKRRL